MDTSMQESIRLDAWRSVFQKTDRILSEQRVTVSIVDDPGAAGVKPGVPAWSDGLDIFFSGPSVAEMLKSNDKMAAVLRLKGLNYHELCHVLYTPRMSDELPRRVVNKVSDTNDNIWWYAFNALEDQRIETWFTAMYGASRRYFEAIILEWIIKNGGTESAVLVYGRKYLTPKIRVQLGRLFVKRYGQPLYDEFRTVIDEYVTLVLPTESIRAMNLLTRFVELLKKMSSISGAPLPALVIADNGGDQCPGHSGSSSPTARSGRVYVKAARKARDKAADMVEDAIDADIEEAERVASESSGQQGGSPKDGAKSQATESGDGQGASNAGDSSHHTDAPEQQGDGVGAADTGTADHVGGDQKDQQGETLEEVLRDVMDAAHDDLDEVQNDEWVQNDVGNLLDAVKAVEQNGRMEAEGAAARSNTVPPGDAERMAVRKVHDVLARIRQEAEPETLWRQTHGRVDPRRIVGRQPHEVDIFKTWDHGNEEETGVEAVVLIDVSGSMSNELAKASSAMWALKRAFDRLDIRTTVMLYDTKHTVLYQPSDKANPGGVPNLRSGGGTDPTSGLIQAQRILSKSSAPNKVLITVTDGAWGGDDGTHKKILRSMHRVGVVSMLLGIGGSYSSYGKHHHIEGHNMESLSDLPRAASKLVASIMRAATV